MSQAPNFDLCEFFKQLGHADIPKAIRRDLFANNEYVCSSLVLGPLSGSVQDAREIDLEPYARSAEHLNRSVIFDLKLMAHIHSEGNTRGLDNDILKDMAQLAGFLQNRLLVLRGLKKKLRSKHLTSKRIQVRIDGATTYSQLADNLELVRCQLDSAINEWRNKIPDCGNRRVKLQLWINEGKGIELKDKDNKGTEVKGTEVKGTDCKDAKGEGAKLEGAEGKSAELEGAESKGAEDNSAESNSTEDKDTEGKDTEGQDTEITKDFKIPTASLPELMVLNEIQQHRDNILNEFGATSDSTLVARTSTEEASVKEREFDQATKIVTESFSEIEKASKEVFVEFKKKHPPCSFQKCTWWPRTVVMLLDTRTRILLSGATQVTGHRHAPFKQSIEAITNARLNGGGHCSFRVLVDRHTEEFHLNVASIATQLGTAIKNAVNSESSFQEIEALHSRVVNDGKTIEEELPTSKKGDVLCWAMDVEKSVGKAPCIRCQRLYPSWYKLKNPSTREDMVEHLGNQLLGNEKSSDYCAETFAAAKLHLLRNGRLALV